MHHLWAPSGDRERPWVYVVLPQAPAMAVLRDAAAPGGIRVSAVDEEATAAAALAVLVRSGSDTFAITRGRHRGSLPAGGLALLAHRDALTFELPGGGDADGQSITLYVCADGLVEVFEYEPPVDQVVPALCAACGTRLEPGEKVRRACPRPDCGRLIHEECGAAHCPICRQEVGELGDPSGIWIPDAPAKAEVSLEEGQCHD